MIVRILCKLVSSIVGIVLLVLIGVAIAGWIKGTSFSIEFMNMFAWLTQSK